MGRPFMPWQSYVNDVAREVDPATGRHVYKTVIVTTPRQSGKTTLEGAELTHTSLVVPSARAWFTMQTGKDAVDWLFNEYWPLLAFAEPHVRLRRSAGSEHVRWVRPGGGLIRPFPPVPTALHSKQSDVVMVDECWAFDPVTGDDLDQAIVPTQATRKGAQVWKLSTAGDLNSTWWREICDQARADAVEGRSSGVAFFEWACPDHLDPVDPASWPVYHPAYGRTIDDEAMMAALDQLGAEGFRRAYGNKWVTTGRPVIDAATWQACAQPRSTFQGLTCFAIDVTLERSAGSIAVAGWRVDRNRHLEVIEHRPGVDWIVARAAELNRRWNPIAVLVDPASPAGSLLVDLDAAGVPTVTVNAQQYAQACGQIFDAITANKVRHLDQPILNQAVAAARKRILGDAWAWARKSGGDISPLVAVTLSHWGLVKAGQGDPQIL